MNERGEQVEADGLSDDELFASVRGEGDAPDPRLDPATALTALFNRYHARVHIWCTRVLGDAVAAEDATQEIFLSLLERPPDYAGRSRFGEWLYVVARNHCLNLNRRRRRQVPLDEVTRFAALLRAPEDPAAEFADADTARIVREVCEDVLNPLEQQVVHLRYHWRLRVKEITELLELPNTSGARSQLATATRKLRRAFLTRFGKSAARSLFREM